MPAAAQGAGPEPATLVVYWGPTAVDPSSSCQVTVADDVGVQLAQLNVPCARSMTLCAAPPLSRATPPNCSEDAGETIVVIPSIVAMAAFACCLSVVTAPAARSSAVIVPSATTPPWPPRTASSARLAAPIVFSAMLPLVLPGAGTASPWIVPSAICASVTPRLAIENVVPASARPVPAA
jgi:hypothetical protein